MNLKSFSIKGVEFRPCGYLDSINSGWRWYSPIVHKSTGMEYDEQHCPKFFNKDQCREYALDVLQQEAILAEARCLVLEQEELETKQQEELETKLILASYENSECPDCGEEIPEDVCDGEQCCNCGHGFFLPEDSI